MDPLMPPEIRQQQQAQLRQYNLAAQAQAAARAAAAAAQAAQDNITTTLPCGCVVTLEAATDYWTAAEIRECAKHGCPTWPPPPEYVPVDGNSVLEEARAIAYAHFRKVRGYPKLVAKLDPNPKPKRKPKVKAKAKPKAKRTAK